MGYKLFLFIIFSIFLACNESNLEEKIEHSYEIEYNLAKWRMYSSNFRNKVTYLDGGITKTKTHVVNCKLKLDKFSENNDTLIFEFSFLHPDSNRVCIPGCESFYNKIIFVKGGNHPFIGGAGLSVTSEMIDNQKKAEKDTVRAIKTIGGVFYPYWAEKEDFNEFLTNTKHPLDAWLKEEAIKKGILEE